jgi:hypothetical protein
MKIVATGTGNITCKKIIYGKIKKSLKFQPVN